MALPWYKWFVRDWLTSSTRFRLSMLERGLYRELLDLHYAEGSIPADETVLARMVVATPEEFASAWPAVSRFFEPDERDSSRLVNRRAIEIGQDQRKWQKRQRVNGSKGGRPKKTQKKPMGFENETQAEPMGLKNETQKKARACASEQNRTEQISTSNEVDIPKPPRGALPAPTPKRNVFGEFGWVQLSELEVQKLHERVGIETAADYIARFDQWVEEAPNAKHSGVKRKDRKAYASILNWIDRDQKEGKHDTRTKRQQIADADDIAILEALRKRSLDRTGAKEVAQDLPDLRPGDDRGRGERLLRIVNGS